MGTKNLTSYTELLVSCQATSVVDTSRIWSFIIGVINESRKHYFFFPLDYAYPDIWGHLTLFTGQPLFFSSLLSPSHQYIEGQNGWASFVSLLVVNY